MSAVDNFATNLSRLMKDGGMSAQALERATEAIGHKVGKSTIDRATRAETPISVPAVEAIAAVFRVEPWQMLRAPMDAPTPVGITLYDALRHLSDILMGVPPDDRKLAALLLSQLATNPGEVDRVAVRLASALESSAPSPNKGSGTWISRHVQTASINTGEAPPAPRVIRPGGQSEES